MQNQYKEAFGDGLLPKVEPFNVEKCEQARIDFKQKEVQNAIFLLPETRE
jgi:hypothetical protein